MEIFLSYGGESFVVGADAESPRMYYLLELCNRAGAHIKIGIVMSYHGIEPSWILSADESTIAVGHDCSISFVDLPGHRLASAQELDGPFYEFVPEESGRDHFIALHELGVDRFNFSGSRVWSVSTPDIAESAHFRDDKTLVVRHQGTDNELLVEVASGASQPGISGSSAGNTELLRRAYAAFNARDIDGALATMGPDVVWPNGMEGGTVHGHEGVRAYWARQWGVVDPHVDPVSFTEDESGRIIIDVHQVVRDLSGKVLLDRMVKHVYTLKDGLIQSMDIRE